MGVFFLEFTHLLIEKDSKTVSGSKVHSPHGPRRLLMC